MLEFKRDIFVISDLHLGDHSKRDNFFVGGKDQNGNEIDRSKLLTEFLDMVEENKGQLVILGDLFEFWQANVGEVIEKNLPLLDRFAEMKAIYVIGNHDVDLEPLVEKRENIFKHPFFSRMTKAFTHEINGKRFKFFHGHEIDPYNKGSIPGLGKIAAICAGIVEDYAGKQFTGDLSTEEVLMEAFDSVSEKLSKIHSGLKEKWASLFGEEGKRNLTPSQSKSQVGKHFELMEAEREKKEFDVAICGHTHMPGKFEDWYANSGSWVKLVNGEPFGDFVWITSGGTYDVCIYKKMGMHAIETEFVRDAESGQVKNFDFVNGCPL